MPRSPELRRLFASSLSAEPIRKKAAEPQYDDKQTSRVERQFSEAENDLAALETAIEQFSANQEQLDDQTFNDTFTQLFKALRQMEHRVFEFYDGQYTREGFVNDFTPLAEITDLRKFIDSHFVYWVPRKQEIARLLNTALLAQPQPKPGEPQRPVRIIDVGGGNAGLAQLLVAMAREHDIALEYTIIDPNDSAVEHAKAGLQDTPEIQFVSSTARDYLAEHYRDSPDIAALFKDRAEKIASANAKLADLRHLSNTLLKKLENKSLTEADYTAYRATLQTDFRLAPPEETSLQDIIGNDELYMHLRGIIEDFRARAQQATDNFNALLERKLAQRAPQVDLVLNSWMSPSVDYTSDLRLLNGAAIAYIIQTSGATGIESGAEPKQVGEEISYKPGNLYQKDSRWYGYDVSKVSGRMPGGHDFGDDPKMNGVYIQRRKDSHTSLHDKIDAGPIKVSDKYPWEDELSSVVRDPKLDAVSADQADWWS